MVIIKNLKKGLGYAGGGGLNLFNDSIKKGETTFRIVKIKRKIEKN
jgi:hypothetical protein